MATDTLDRILTRTDWPTGLNWGNTKGTRAVAFVVDLIVEMSAFLPLTLRQIHYQLVDDLPEYRNTLQQYKSLSGWIYNARIDGLINWNAIEDQGRSFNGAGGWQSPGRYLSAYRRAARIQYRRDVTCDQEQRIEVWTEKATLVRILRRYCEPYRIGVQNCGGFGSGSAFQDAYNRRDGRPTRILYCGDHDPSGMWMSERDIPERFAGKHSFKPIVQRIALTTPMTRDLPRNYESLKPKDSRTPWYIERWGNESWEVDALKPPVLGKLVIDAIESHLDMDMLAVQHEIEKADITEIHRNIAGWRIDRQ